MPTFKKFVVSGSLLLGLVACDSSSQPDPFEILNPTWCEAAMERDDEGVYSEMHYLSYDQNGNWIQTDFDYKNDGSIDTRIVREYEKDFAIVHTVDNDLEEEGYSYRITWKRDSVGHILIESTDYSGDGIDEEVRTNEWHGDRLVRSTYDRQNNGIVDEFSLYTYEGSVLLSIKIYLGSEDIGQEPYLKQYNTNDGHLVRIVSRTLSTGESARWEYKYDSQDRPIYRQKTRGTDFTTVEWHYDTRNGRLHDERTTFSSGGEVSGVLQFFYNYDCDGNASVQSLVRGAMPHEPGSPFQPTELGAGFEW